MHRSLLASAALIAFAGLTVPAATMQALAASTIYDSTVTPLPGGMPSEAFQATQTSEFGDEVNFAGTDRLLQNVVVTMVSWACQSGSATDGTCSTTPGATFSEPITLNIYLPPTGSGDTPGTQIATLTTTFAIPYRPSADSSCSNGGFDPPSCYHGYANNITFDFSSQTVLLPNTVVWGVVYNTSGFGPSPYGYSQACNTAGPGNSDACPYDSLNVAVSGAVTTGSQHDPQKAWLDSVTGGQYCDGGAAGTAFFRLDSPGTDPSDACWNDGNGNPYIPAAQFNATTLGTPTPEVPWTPALLLGGLIVGAIPVWRRHRRGGVPPEG